MEVTCEASTCGDGEVGVEIPTNPWGDREEDILGTATDQQSTIECVVAPPACAGGTSPLWIYELPDALDSTQTSGGFWTCSPPCTVIVDFGGIYGFQSVCADAPPSCGGGLVPTYQYELQDWECAAMCDGGLYDPVDWAGATVCVPC